MPAEIPHLDSYADALLTLARAVDQVGTIERELVDMLALVKNDSRVLSFIGDPNVSNEGKEGALRELLTGRVHPVLMHFVLILKSQGRLPDLPAIADRFFLKTAARTEKASGLLLTARPLPDGYLSRIEEEVSRILGRNVHLLIQEDASLLGGLKVQVGDFVIDGTIDSHLEKARHALVS